MALEWIAMDSPATHWLHSVFETEVLICDSFTCKTDSTEE